MKSGPLTLEARVTPEVFREFAFFDTFRRQKRWRGPALFALIMGGFAAVCFALRESREQAVLIGTVLLVVGGYLLKEFVIGRTPDPEHISIELAQVDEYNNLTLLADTYWGAYELRGMKAN